MNKKNIKYWITGSVLLIVTIGSILPFLFAKSQLTAVTEELKRESLPLTFREFADKYYKPVPEYQNAAEIFETAYSLLADTIPNDDRLIIQGLDPDLKDDKAEKLWERRHKDVIFAVLDKKKNKN